MQALQKAKKLVEAINSENIILARQLLLEDANPNLIIPDGISAFHLAVGIESEDALEYVKLMLQYGGNPNIRSTDGMTPVLIAAAYGRYQALHLLLDRGGDPSLVDDAGKNALDYAKVTSSWDCITLLKEPINQQENVLLPEVSANASELYSMHQDTSRVTNLDDSDEYLSAEYSTINSRPCSPDDANTTYALQDKVISQSYLASRQGFDVTSPDNPTWFFKGSVGSTIMECCGLDKTMQYSKSNDSSSSFVTCSDSLSSVRKRVYNGTSRLKQGMDFSDTYTISRKLDTNIATKDLCDETYTVCRIPSDNNSLTSICDSYSQIANNSCLSFRHHDKELNTVLIEHQFPSVSSIQVDSSSFDVSYSDDDATVIYDWQGYQSIQNAPCQLSSSLLRLSDAQIRQQLTDYGYSVGPIMSTTRKVFLQRLHKLKTDPKALAAALSTTTRENKGFRFELALYLNGILSLSSNIDEQEVNMVAPFQQPERDWREGNLKSSFNYLLLDPRVSRNLPLRYMQLSSIEAFTIFVKAVFYVGKGKRNRPYAHFNEALKKDTDKQPSPKVKHIIDIWEEGHGVVSLHCFQSTIPVEAYTREACMLDALGLSRLTNKVKGNYYGDSASWLPPKQRTMGVHLLKKACQIFLVEGERQIRPGDIGRQ